MVINFTIKIILDLITLLMWPATLIPWPSMPTAIVTASGWVIDQIGTANSILSLIYGSTYLPIISIILLVVNFEGIWHSVWWAIRKIPIVNIK